MENKIKDGLKTDFIGQNIVYVEETTSTNTLAKNNTDCVDGTVFIANSQTAGRGRMGREWQSQKDVGIWMSILLKPPLCADDISKITLVAGIAICKAIGHGAKIKYPNDIVIGTKKVCGILTELKQDKDGLNNVICGIGVNVNQVQFNGELSNKATSLYETTKTKHNRALITQKLLEEFENVYTTFLNHGFSAIIDEYKSNCINIGREIKATYNNKEIIGKCTDITENGEIVIDANGTLIKISSGEVSVRGIYGYV